MEPRPEPRSERISIKGVLGLVVGLGFVVVILRAVPAARWFLLISIPLGCLVAGILYLWHKHRPVKVKEVETWNWISQACRIPRRLSK